MLSSTQAARAAHGAGNEFWLSVYRDYNDVRLVFAPPSSVGKFGWDTDDLEWGEEGIFDVDAYFVEMQKLQEEYAGKLNIRIGILNSTGGWNKNSNLYLENTRESFKI